MKPNLPLARGFTLIELIITTVIIGIMAAALAPLALSSLRAYRETVDDVAVLDKLRYATERLGREIREVNAIKDGSGNFTNFAFTSMAVNSVAFTRTYFDAVGTEGSNTVVRICASGTNLTLSYNSAATGCPDAQGILLTDDLSAFTLSYFDKAGNATNAASDVRSVGISVTLTHGLTYTQQTRVELKRYPGT